MMNLIQYQSSIQFKTEGGQKKLWDIVRNKWIYVTPEEVVRQCVLWYIIDDKKYSKRLIAVEKSIIYYKVKKRFDIVVFNKKLAPIILVECKNPEVALDQKSLNQIQTYDHIINGQHLWLTNGHENIIFAKAAEDDQIRSLADIPSKQELKKG